MQQEQEKPSMSKLLTRGGQITFNNLRMFMQVNQQIAHWCLILMVVLITLSMWVMVSFETIRATYYYIASVILYKIGLSQHVFHFIWKGREINVDVFGVLSERYFRSEYSLFLSTLKNAFYFSLCAAFLLATSITLWLIRRGKSQSQKQHIRGARMAEPKVVSKMIKKFGSSDIVIESIPMVKDFEVRHTLIHGTTGSGKGQTFNQFIEQIRKRGDSAIVYDKGCVFTSLFYSAQRDVILNPFDERCAYWDLWHDAKTEPDFENIAESLIPMHGESDPYWVDAARTVFSTAAFRMQSDEERSIEKLFSLILTADLDVLGSYLKGTQAATLVSDKIEKTAISIRSVLSTYLKSLRFLKGLDTRTPFSIREWVQQIANQKQSHFLFISSMADQHAALRPLISMWLSMASISLLSLEENFERRIWFICDELPTLHKLPQLGETISEVRKFGGCFVLGMQSFSQLQKVYGRASAAEIFDLLNTRFFFRSPSSDMGDLVSRELGHEDIEQSSESYSYGSNTIRDGITIGSQRSSRPLVSSAEIMEMPDLTAYLRVPAPVPITKLNIAFRKRKKVNEGFLLREMRLDKAGKAESNQETSVQDPDSYTSESPLACKVNLSSSEIADTRQPIAGEYLPEKTEEPSNVLQRQEENILADQKDEKEYETFI